MKAPFIYFGGKRKVAHLVWDALGDVANYVEPFAGSLAVLLERPPSDKIWIETVNDADHFLSNFWRALANSPREVARWADWPVNEDDLFARHMWLVTEGKKKLEKGIYSNPDFFDPQIAGWWVWGINSWIAGGWCSGKGPWHVCADDVVRKFRDQECICISSGNVLNAEEETTDVEQKKISGNGVQGVSRRLPHLGNSGQGVNRQLHSESFHEQNKFSPCDSIVHPDLEALETYFLELAARLRRVRVCSGDWKRVVTTGALSAGSSVGVFLDPPYSGAVRTTGIYAHDSSDVSVEVREWAVANGDNPRLKIVLAGYSDEYDDGIPDSWTRVRWSAGSSYQNSRTQGKNSVNRHKEVLWLSPRCEKSVESIF